MLVKSIISRVTLQQQPPQDKNKNKKIIYIDTDTQFTAYLKAGFFLRQEIEEKRQKQLKNNTMVVSNNGNPSIRLIDIYLPSEGRFESMLGNVISSMPEASIVIFDSLNSYYNVYPTRTPESEQSGRPRSTRRQREMELSERGNWGDGQPSSISDRLSRTEPAINGPKVGHSISRLNHLLSIYIMLLVKHGVYHNIPVIVTSMVRYKKVAEGLWTKSPACRRLLNQKSVVRLSVEMDNEKKDLSVNVMKHPLIGQQTIAFPDAGIYSSFETDQT